jgi:hypothetical protein
MKTKLIILLPILLCFFLSSSCDNDSTQKEDSNWEKPNPETEDTAQLISADKFSLLFPYRYGAEADNNWAVNPQKDFYTYEALKKAIEEISNIKIIIERKGSFLKITRMQKSTNNAKVIREDPNFNASWNTANVIREEIDYADFINEGSTEIRKKELAAFFANISHETTGGWSTAPGGAFSWGLHFREEIGFENGEKLSYIDENNKDYPAIAGQSYHGRGPIQLSWNYNYGKMSELLFGDKNVLLLNPGIVSKDAVVAFETAICFWMTPQPPKPSCHDAITGKWKPTQDDINAGRKPGFGMTINIINGGLECNQADNTKTQDRRGFYERYLNELGTSDPNCECKCDKMKSY